MHWQTIENEGVFYLLYEVEIENYKIQHGPLMALQMFCFSDFLMLKNPALGSLHYSSLSRNHISQRSLLIQRASNRNIKAVLFHFSAFT